MQTSVIEFVPPFNLDVLSQRYYLAMLSIYEVVSAEIIVATAPLQSYGKDFHLNGCFLVWTESRVRIDTTDKFTLRLQARKTRDHTAQVCLSMGQQAISHLSSAVGNLDALRTEGFLREYIDANGALDAGDFAAAARSYGSALEALLNRQMSTTFNLSAGINNEPLFPAWLKQQLHFIRAMRNRIHPALTAQAGVPTYADLQSTRTAFESLLHLLR